MRNVINVMIGLCAALVFVLTGCNGSSGTSSSSTVEGNITTNDSGSIGASQLQIASPVGTSISVQAGTIMKDASGTPVVGNIRTSASVLTTASSLPAAAQILPPRSSFMAVIDINMGTVKTFSLPLTVTQDMTSSGAKTGDTVSFYSFNSVTNKWTLEGSAVVDATGKATLQVNHLSLWGVFRSFSQTDLTGSWNFSGLQIGLSEGWQRGATTIDSTGSLTFDSILNSAGSTTAPAAPGAIKLAIDTKGIVSLAEAPTLRGIMSSSKDIVIQTQSFGPTNTGSQFIVFQKNVPGVAFSNSDLIGSWNFSGMQIGLSEGWQRGSLTIDGTGSVTFNSILNSAGSTTPPDVPPGGLKFTFDSNGNVSLADFPTLRGIMSSNKDLIVQTQTFGPTGTGSQFIIFQKKVPGVTFSNADLIGTWYFSGMQTSGPGWVTGILTIDSTGSLDFSSYLDSTGNTTPPATAGVFKFAIDSSGKVSFADSPTLKGIMSSSKNMIVQTQTIGGAGSQLLILQK